MLTSIIVAVSKNGIIGKDNQLLWRLPDDLKRFKQLTLNHPIIMGRKTFESIGKPLPGRTSIVITRQTNFHVDGVLVAHSLENALDQAKDLETPEAFIIGGGEIYRQAQAVADKLYLTKVHTVIEGDTSFKIENPEAWKESERVVHEADEKHEFKFEFVNYIKQKF